MTTTTTNTIYYTYRHHAGYGSEDHLADELIARAARQLGLGAGNHILRCVGLASHAVPMDGCEVRVPDGRGVRRRLESALRSARAEVRRIDCIITVERVRESTTVTESGRERRYVHTTYRREGRDWVPESMWSRYEWMDSDGRWQPA